VAKYRRLLYLHYRKLFAAKSLVPNQIPTKFVETKSIIPNQTVTKFFLPNRLQPNQGSSFWKPTKSIWYLLPHP